MRTALWILALAATLGLCTACAGHSQPKRPRVYQGGGYYGEAVHSGDLTNR